MWNADSLVFNGLSTLDTRASFFSAFWKFVPLDTDEGARYIGEFAFGLNPYVERPIGDTLFDEKIKGSFHFTPGDALEESDNGNRSSIHWDIVNIQRKEYGGGEIYFDDVLIRKDGIFVLPDLQALNPENLI